MLFTIEGDLIICDARVKAVAKVKPELLFDSGVGPCYMIVHPVEDYKKYITDREAYINEKINASFSGVLPRSSGKFGTDSGKIGVFKLENIEDLSSLVKGEYFKVRDFKGKFGRIIDKYGMTHLYASGNYNFYTL